MPCSCGKHRTRQGCAGAKVLAQMSREWRQENGRAGGAWRGKQAELRLAEKYNTYTREAAIMAAWRDGRECERHKMNRQVALGQFRADPAAAQAEREILMRFVAALCRADAGGYADTAELRDALACARAVLAAGV